MKPTLLKLHSIFDPFKSSVKKVNGLAYGAALYLVLMPGIATAASIATGICGVYNQVVSSELIGVLVFVLTAIAIFAYKLAKDNKFMATVLGILIAAGVLLNLPTFISAAGFSACSATTTK